MCFHTGDTFPVGRLYNIVPVPRPDSYANTTGLTMARITLLLMLLMLMSRTGKADIWTACGGGAIEIERPRVCDNLPDIHKRILHAISTRITFPTDKTASLIPRHPPILIKDRLPQQMQKLRPRSPGGRLKQDPPDTVRVSSNGILPARREVETLAVPVQHAVHVGAPPAADEGAAGEDLLAEFDPAAEGGPEALLEEVGLLLVGDAALADAEDEGAVGLGGVEPVEVAVGGVAVHGAFMGWVGEAME